MYILINYCTFLHHLHMHMYVYELLGMEWNFPSSKRLVSILIYRIFQFRVFICISIVFLVAVNYEMRLEGDIVLLVEHLDKRTGHQALHQTLLAVHVILVNG